MPENREDLHVAFARFEGTVSTEIKNLAHDMKNLFATLAAYATTRDLKAAEDRVTKLESNQTWIVRSIVGAVVSALLAGVVAVAKGGHL